MTDRQAWLVSGIGIGLALLVGCGSTTSSGHLSRGRQQALQAENPALALAYEDKMLEVARLDDDERGRLRTSRSRNFARVVERELATLGERGPANAEATYKRLAAIMVNAATGPHERRSDLAPVIDGLVVPRLEATAMALWPLIDAMVASGEVTRAVRYGAAVAEPLPKDGPFATRLEAIRGRLRDEHLARARGALDQPGLRVLRARLAHQLGAPPVDAQATTALAETLGQAIQLTVDGTCAEASTFVKSRSATTGPGRPALMTVTITGCEVTPRRWTTTETETYGVQVKKLVPTEVVRSQRVCTDVDTSSGLSAPVLTSQGANGQRQTCETRDVKGMEMREVIESTPATETFQMQHWSARATLSGRLQLAWQGVSAEVPFQLVSSSDDLTEYKTVHVGTQVFKSNADEQARTRVHEALLPVIDALKLQVREARAAALLTQANASAAQNADSAAEDAYFVASQLTGKADPAFLGWMETHHKIVPEVVLAASADQAPPLYVIAGDEFQLPEVDAKLLAAEIRYTKGEQQDDDERDARRTIQVSLGVGPSWVSSEAAGKTLFGGIASLGLFYLSPSDLPAHGFGMRLSGGLDQGLTGYLDFDFLVGAGVRLGSLAVVPVVGVGADLSSGETGVGGSNDFVLPKGGYVEYGGRIAYAFRFLPFSFELIFTKPVRTSSEIPSERRADVRLTYRSGQRLGSITARYGEYAAERDGLLTVFTSADRVAQQAWVLWGMGF